MDATSGVADRSFPAVTGTVNAVASDGAGGYYIGGTFTAVDGIARTNLAHILGTGALDARWRPTTNNPVKAPAFSTAP